MPADTSSIYLDKLCCQAFGGLYISYMIQLYTYSSTIHHAQIIGILLKGCLNNLVGCLFIACILNPFLEFLNNVIACLQHAQIIDFSVFNYIEVCLQHAQIIDFSVFNYIEVCLQDAPILGILFHVFTYLLQLHFRGHFRVHFRTSTPTFICGCTAVSTVLQLHFRGHFRVHFRTSTPTFICGRTATSLFYTYTYLWMYSGLYSVTATTSRPVSCTFLYIYAYIHLWTHSDVSVLHLHSSVDVQRFLISQLIPLRLIVPYLYDEGE